MWLNSHYAACHGALQGPDAANTSLKYEEKTWSLYWSDKTLICPIPWVLNADMDLISEEFLKNNKVLCLSSQKRFNQLQQHCCYNNYKFNRWQLD